jgi:hypothetical protein
VGNAVTIIKKTPNTIIGSMAMGFRNGVAVVLNDASVGHPVTVQGSPVNTRNY